MVKIALLTATTLAAGLLPVEAQEYWLQHLKVKTESMTYDPVDGQFLGAGDEVVWFSDDGSLWTGHVATGTHKDVVRANGLYVAAGNAEGKKQVAISVDTFQWTPIPFDLVGTFNGVTYAFGKFWICGDSGDIRSSVNGITWTKVEVPTVFASTNFNSISLVNGTLMVTGASGRILTSPNGTTWSSLIVEETTAKINAIIWSAEDSQYVLGTSDGTVFTSADTAAWQLRAILTFPVRRLVYQPSNMPTHDGYYMASGDYESLAASETGAVWDTIQQTTQIFPITKLPFSIVMSLAVGEGLTVAGSNEGPTYYMESPYLGYNSTDTAKDWQMNGMAYGEGYFLGAGDDFALARWDGITGWQQFFPVIDEDASPDDVRYFDATYGDGSFIVRTRASLRVFPDIATDMDNYFSIGQIDTIDGNSVAAGYGYIITMGRDGEGAYYAVYDDGGFPNSVGDPVAAVGTGTMDKYHTWTNSVAGLNHNGDPIFVACGLNGQLYVFSAALGWTPYRRASGTEFDFVDITFVDDVGLGNRGFFAVTSNGVITHSVDALFWRSLKIDKLEGQTPTAIRYGNGQLVVVCKSGAIFTSVVADGASTGGINPSWTQRGSPVPVVVDSSNPLLKGLEFDGTKFSAMGFNSAISSTNIVLPPYIVCEGTADGKVGSSFSFKFSIVGENGDASLTGEIPPGLRVSGENIIGTPTVAGVYDMQINATGVGGSASRTVIVTIATAAGTPPDDPDDPGSDDGVNVPEPPPKSISITSKSIVRAKINKQFSYTISTNIPTKKITVSKLPYGLKLKGNRIVGRPKAGGTYRVTIKVVAKNGKKASKTIRIIVKR